MKKLILTILLITSGYSHALETLIDGAKITRIANSGNVADDFYVYVSGGSGPCKDTGIVFPRSEAPSQAFHDRAFSIALAAFVAKEEKVRISARSNSCLGAVLIEVQK